MNIIQNLKLLKNRICIYPGHYYSPIPSVREVLKHDELFDYTVPTVPGIDLRYQQQMDLIEKSQKYYKEAFIDKKELEKHRYYFENNFYSYADGIFYYFMLRNLCPRKVIEIGSGFSTALLLDVNENIFHSCIDCTFIEPYTKRLKSLLLENDEAHIIEKNLQEVECTLFESLQAGDILFIDSTHVVKTGSDVNHIFTKILPCLPEGVYIHFHDVFYPFEYPKEWVIKGKAWNEDYMLRSFLQYNNAFEIVLWNDYLIKKNRNYFSEHMPLCLKNSGGSIWLKKVVGNANQKTVYEDRII